MSDQDRERFRAKLRDFISRPNVHATAVLTPGMVCVCTLAREFRASDNALFECTGNHSFPREDVRCAGCGEALTVSNWMYRQMIHMTTRPRVVCIYCGPGAAA